MRLKRYKSDIRLEYPKKGKIKMKKTTVNFSNEVYYYLQKESEKKNKTKTDIINLAVQNYFEKNTSEIIKLNIENLVKEAIKDITTDEKFINDLQLQIARLIAKK